MPIPLPPSFIYLFRFVQHSADKKITFASAFGDDRVRLDRHDPSVTFLTFPVVSFSRGEKLSIKGKFDENWRLEGKERRGAEKRRCRFHLGGKCIRFAKAD